LINTVYIGFDKVEEVAYHTLVSSIMRHASRPVRVAALDRSKMRFCHNRKIDPKQSNGFTYIRFLVPYLENYQGWSLFMDSDMMLRDDINKLFDLADEQYDVMCVQHPDYVSTLESKYLGTKQYNYPRKNWSSVMLFNNAKCKTLTPDYVDSASPADLHRMKWADNIGALHKDWNHLVGEQPENPNARIVHFTLGTPCWPRFKGCEYADEWEQNRRQIEWYLPEDVEESA